MLLRVQTPKAVHRPLSWTDTLIRGWPSIAPLPFLFAKKRDTTPAAAASVTGDDDHHRGERSENRRQGAEVDGGR